MFNDDELIVYETEFNKIGITDKSDVITILDYLSSIAEIGYNNYNKNVIYDKEKEV